MATRSICRSFAFLSLFILLFSFPPTGSLPAAAQQPQPAPEQAFRGSPVLPAENVHQPAAGTPNGEIAAVLASIPILTSELGTLPDHVATTDPAITLTHLPTSAPEISQTLAVTPTATLEITPTSVVPIEVSTMPESGATIVPESPEVLVPR